MNTKNPYKNSTKVSKVNNNSLSTHDIFINIMMKRGHCDVGCVSNYAHRLICEHKFLEYVGDEPIFNKKLLGTACETNLRWEYNSAINNYKFFRSYELYEDIHLHTQINKIINYNHHCDCKIQPNINDKRLNQIQADFEAFLGEKRYTPNLKNGVDCYEFFKKQQVEIENIDDQIIIKFPLDREFTLPDEIKAINIITKERNGLQTINFKDHTITIQKRDIEADTT